MCRRFLFLHSLSSLYHLCFWTRAILTSVRWHLIIVLICISLLISEGEHFSSAFWPSVCLLWRNVYLNIRLPGFQVRSFFVAAFFCAMWTQPSLNLFPLRKRYCGFSALPPSAPGGWPLMDSSESQCQGSLICTSYSNGCVRKVWQLASIWTSWSTNWSILGQKPVLGSVSPSTYWGLIASSNKWDDTCNGPGRASHWAHVNGWHCHSHWGTVNM